MRLQAVIALAGAACILGGNRSAAANWPQFRGPQSNNISAETGLPVEWSADKVKWKYAPAGEGWSCPVVWEDKVFLTTAVGEQSSVRLEVHCLNRLTGEPVWKKVAYEGPAPIGTHQDNTYASETPATDGERLYVYFGMVGVFCYDLNGNPVWDRKLGSFPMQGDWGTSSSPLLYKDKLYLQVDNEQESFLVALDSKTGNEIKKISRQEKSNWSTPMIWENSERVELVVQGKVARSYNPDTLEEYWRMDMGGGRCCASPTGDKDRLLVGTENWRGGGHLYCVLPGASGDLTITDETKLNPKVAWAQRLAGPFMSSALLYKDFIYVLERSGGRLTVRDAKTGAVAYQERLPQSREFWASPWIYQDLVFCLDATGNTHVIKPGGKYELVRTNSIADRFWSSAAIADGQLLLRGTNNIYSIQQ